MERQKVCYLDKQMTSSLLMILFSEVAEMLPAILSQMGPESLEHVKRFAYTGGQQRLSAQMAAKTDAGEEADADSDDEDVPDLVSNFDEPSKDEANVAKPTETTTTPSAAGNFQ
jgi:hypothetical protein